MYKGTASSPVVPLRVHDLLQLAEPACTVDHGDEPPWVQNSLRLAPWVVVRRAAALSGSVAVGVRGAERHHRWGTFAAINTIRSVVTPAHLRSSMATLSNQTIPAMEALCAVEVAWGSYDLTWGPVGSVGFELASGQRTVSRASDLDLALFATDPVHRSILVELWKRVDGLPCKVDIRVELSAGSFSLEEYVREEGGPMLVRTIDGPKLCADPWTVNAREAAE